MPGKLHISILALVPRRQVLHSNPPLCDKAENYQGTQSRRRVKPLLFFKRGQRAIMSIVKPNWVIHGDPTQSAKTKRPCIYSIHVHPEGKKLATGGLDTTVKIWNTEPIMSETAENDPNCHKLLCTMTLHGGAVLCVRWSHNGRYLASSSDNDNVIIIWELDKGAGSSTVFGSAEMNHETWRAVTYLRGHGSDVQDLAWSIDDRHLASCGVDGYVIVWDAITFEQVKKIDQHGGFVKGVTWDPAGKYLATQSDDKILKIWRTADWGLEQDIKEPFNNAPGTTFFRRLSWSPDGSYIAAANAVNANQCIAAIIYRDEWASDLSLIGHEVPIEVTSTNPKLFYVKESREGTTDETDQQESLASVCALGDQQGSMSIWVTKHSRPLCVVTKTFDGSVYDLAWSPDGKSLFACSEDGTVAHMYLGDYLSRSASDDEIIKGLEQYGYGRRNVSLPETPTQLDLEEENAIIAKASASKRLTELMGDDPHVAKIPTLQSSNTSQSSLPSPSLHAEPTFVPSIQKSTPTILEQKVTIGKDGKRRIQPVMIHSVASKSQTSHASEHGQKSSLSNVEPNSNSRAAGSRLSAMETIDYDSPAASIPQSGIETVVIGNKRRIKEAEEDAMDVDGNEIRIHDTGVPSRSKGKPTWVDSAVIPPVVSQSKAQLGVPKVKSTLLRKLSSKDSTIVMECHNAIITDGVSHTKLIVSSKGSVLWTDHLPSAILLMTGNNIFSAIGCEDGTIHVYSSAGRRLFSPIVLESTPVILHCSEKWLLCLTATGLIYTWDIPNKTSNLSSISIAPILRIAQIESSKTPKTAPTIKDVRIHLNGIPLLITNYRQAFAYDLNMKSWMRISDAWYVLSDFWDPHGRPGVSDLDKHPLGWLSMSMNMGGDIDATSNTLARLASSDKEVGSSVTISHIENQLAVAVLLESADEYEEWLLCYARRLSAENAQNKAEELCRWLLGPPFTSTEHGKWESEILEKLSKRELLGKILRVLGQNRLFQRVVSEYKEAL